MTGNGMLNDSSSKVWLIYDNGLEETETNGRPKWGIAFALDHKAFQLWKKSGDQVAFQSAQSL
jgi:hypothetical protein